MPHHSNSYLCDILFLFKTSHFSQEFFFYTWYYLILLLCGQVKDFCHLVFLIQGIVSTLCSNTSLSPFFFAIFRFSLFVWSHFCFCLPNHVAFISNFPFSSPSCFSIYSSSTIFYCFHISIHSAFFLLILFFKCFLILLSQSIHIFP